MLDLRDYQRRAVDAVREAFRSGKRRPLLVAPTGAGKTVIFSYITANASLKGHRTTVLVHRAELLTQTSKALQKMGVSHGLVAAGKTPDPTQSVQVASVQTLVRRLDKFPRPDLIIVDEAHHACAGSWQKVMEAYPSARILGVTATPQRLDGKGLSSAFDDLICGPEVIDLITAGWLSRPVYYAPTTVDMTGARTTGGDWNRADAEAKTDRPTITGDAVTHYRKLCDGVPAIAFCTSVKHAEHVAQAFNAAGYKAAVLDGSLAPAERASRVAQLGNGGLNLLATCDIVSEGFDLPLVTAAILLRPTQSVSLHLQQIGRVLRPAAGKGRAFILDHVGNCLRHGLAEEPREWSLDGAKKRKKGTAPADDVAAHRQCPACFCVHQPAPICPQCQHVYEVKVRNLEQVDGTLEELKVDLAAMRAMKAKRQEQGRAQSLEELIALGKARGYKNPAAWAKHLFHARRARTA
jgi:superfamily II DNA or RNA helicase